MDNYTDIYDEKEWNLLTEPSTNYQNQDTSSDDNSSKQENVQKKKVSTPVLTFQLVICLLFLTIMFLLKTFASDVFTGIKAWYDLEIKASMFYSGDFSQIDYSSIFSSTTDEV